MSKENIVSIQVPEQDLQQAITNLQATKELLKPYLIALQASDRIRLPKMGDKTLPFVRKAAEYTQSRQDFSPPYLNADELAIDLKAVEDLTLVYREAEQLCKSLNDTIMLSGSEAYAEALAYYQAVKQAAKRNVPDAKTVYQDLRQRFEQRSSGSDTPSS